MLALSLVARTARDKNPYIPPLFMKKYKIIVSQDRDIWVADCEKFNSRNFGHTLEQAIKGTVIDIENALKFKAKELANSRELGEKYAELKLWNKEI